MIDMFMGEYNHTIDAKGRLIVPSKFREQLGDEFVVTKGLDGCLFVYDNTEWKKFEEKLQALPLTNQNARKFSRFFLAGASACEVDRQGRILLPSVLRDFAGLEKEVVLVGIIAEVLNVEADEITLNTTFVDDLGADSLDIFQIIMGIEEAFDIEIPTEEAEKIVSVGDAVEQIKNALN